MATLEIRTVGSGGMILQGTVGTVAIEAGHMVAQLAADGTIVAAGTALSGPCIGVALHAAAIGAQIEIETDRVFEFANGTAGDACSSATLYGYTVYCGNSYTVYDNDAGGTLFSAGQFVGLTSDSTPRVKVKITPGYIAASTLAASVVVTDAHNHFDTDTVEAALNQIVDDLALTTATHGANMIGFEDSGSKTTSATVDAALDEIYAYLLAPKTIRVSLADLREVDSSGDFGNIAANGGLLASDTTPILRADAAESVEISWAASNSDPVGWDTSLPVDFDDTGDVTVDLWVYSGTTDAADISIETSWDGGAKVVDAVSDTATKSATVHKLTATIANGDIPAGAHNLTINLVPPAHTTNAIGLTGMRINYQPKLA